MIGRLDTETGEFSGKDIVYLFPDLANGIKGRFEDSKLVVGRPCIVVGAELDPIHDLLIPKVVERYVGTANDAKVKKDVSTRNRIYNLPMVPDVWETQRVEVRTSLTETEEGIDAGEGLFAKTKIRKGQIVALYNGVRQESIKNSSSDYRIRLSCETDLDIPAECKDVKTYCATLCHKANHSFSPNTRSVIYRKIASL